MWNKFFSVSSLAVAMAVSLLPEMVRAELSGENLGVITVTGSENINGSFFNRGILINNGTLHNNGIFGSGLEGFFLNGASASYYDYGFTNIGGTTVNHGFFKIFNSSTNYSSFVNSGVVETGHFDNQSTLVSSGRWASNGFSNRGSFLSATGGFFNNLGDFNNYGSVVIQESSVVNNSFSLRNYGAVVNSGELIVGDFLNSDSNRFENTSTGRFSALFINGNNIDNRGNVNVDGAAVGDGFNNSGAFYARQIDSFGVNAINSGDLTIGDFTNHNQLSNSGNLTIGGNYSSGIFRNEGRLINEVTGNISTASFVENIGVLENQGSINAGTNLYDSQVYFQNLGTVVNSGHMVVHEFSNSGEFENSSSGFFSAFSVGGDNVVNRGHMQAEDAFFGEDFDNSGVLNTRRFTSIGSNAVNAGSLSAIEFSNLQRFTNQGHLNVGDNSGAISGISGNLVNDTTGVIHLSGRVENFGEIVNRGSIQGVEYINNYQKFDNQADLQVGNGQSDFVQWNNYREILNSAKLVVGSNASIQGGGYLTQTAGELNVDGFIQQSSVDLRGGSLTGNGVIAATVFVNGGTIAAGHSPGTLRIDGDLNILAGSLDVELANLSVFDQLVINGNAYLGGTLNLYAIEGYMPVIGDSFNFLSFYNVFGQFERIALHGFESGIGVRLTQLSNQLQLSIVAVPLPATIWLFGSVLLGAVGFVRSRKAA